MSKRRAGRPSSLTKKAEEDFCALIEAGLPESRACVQAGIKKRSLANYKHRGNRWLEYQATLDEGAEWTSEIPPQDHAIYGRFVQNLQRARADFEHKRLTNIAEAGSGGRIIAERFDAKTGQRVEVRYAPPDWRADAWLLVHRGGKDYRKPDARSDAGDVDDEARVEEVRFHVVAGRKVSSDFKEFRTMALVKGGKDAGDGLPARTKGRRGPTDASNDRVASGGRLKKRVRDRSRGGTR